MATFKDREQSFEAKFAHDAELKFKAEMKRNKIVGAWAAAELGLSGDAAETYIKDVIKADFEEAGDEDVLRKISKDFKEKSVSKSDDDIRTALDKAMAEVMAELG